MSEDTWTKVDEYLTEQLIGSDPQLDATLAATSAAGIRAIAVSPPQGKLLHLLALSIGARSVLEIGTLGGYSTIWLARALGPGGRLVTLEADPKNAQVALANIERAGVAEIIELRFGRALETLPRLAAEGGESFDLVFLDADKPSTPDYFTCSL